MNPEAPIFSWLIYGAEVFGFATALLHVFMCWRLSNRSAPPARLDVTVDVFVPTYNESVDLVRKTLLAARSMDHPHKTWLLDDGRRPEMRALAAQLGCEYLERGDNLHAKAGNLNHALQHSSGELIAIFDADHAPRRDFLAKTLGYFENPRVAFVQTPQDFYNLDSYQHRRGGAAGPSDPHHYGTGGGMGQKTDDYRTVPLCRRCHDHFHDHRELPGMGVATTRVFLLQRQVDLLVAWARMLVGQAPKARKREMS